MDPLIPLRLPVTGLHGPVYEQLFALYLGIGIVAALLVFSLMAYLIHRYRAAGPSDVDPPDAPRAGAAPIERGDRRVPLVLALLVTLVLFSVSLGTFDTIALYHDEPNDPDALRIDVVAYRYGFSYTYPDGSVVVDNLTVPVDRTVVLKITSTDVFHNFAVPELRLKADAIPGHTTMLWFKGDSPGTHRIQCMELCGTDHGAMVGSLRILSAPEYDQWVARGG